MRPANMISFVSRLLCHFGIKCFVEKKQRTPGIIGPDKRKWKRLGATEKTETLYSLTGNF
jgi:hypothetical protein